MKKINIEHTEFDKRKLFPLTNYAFTKDWNAEIFPLWFLFDIILWNVGLCLFTFGFVSFLLWVI